MNNNIQVRKGIKIEVIIFVYDVLYDHFITKKSGSKSTFEISQKLYFYTVMISFSFKANESSIFLMCLSVIS